MKDLLEIIGDSILYILVIAVALMGAASFAANTIPNTDITPGHRQIERTIAQPYATPRPHAPPPQQWSNAYWEERAAERDARNAQYKTR